MGTEGTEPVAKPDLASEIKKKCHRLDLIHQRATEQAEELLLFSIELLDIRADLTELLNQIEQG